MSKKKLKTMKNITQPTEKAHSLPAQKESLTYVKKRKLINSARYQALIPVLFILIGFIIYSNILHSPFILDDTDAILQNKFIRLEKISWTNLVNAAIGYGKNRPVAMLSFAFNYYLGQYNVVGYHLVNICIHIATGILLFFFIKITLTLINNGKDSTRQLSPTTIITLSFFTALLWLVNPVQTQSVTYIVQRMNSMGAMFYILTLLLYAKGRLAQQQALRAINSKSQKDVNKHQLKSFNFWFIGCFIAGGLALGSKESTAMLPVFIFLYEWYFFQNLDKNWFKKKLKYLLLIAVVFSVIAGMYLDFDPIKKFGTLRDFGFGEFTIGERLLTQTRVVVYYLSLIYYPSPSRLNLDYDFPLSYSLFNPFTTFICLLFIIGSVILGVYLARKQPLISFCIFWFLGNLVIESSFIPLAIIYEHRLYLPSMLVLLLTAVLIYRYVQPVWVACGIACAAVIVCSYWTFERNRIWQDPAALWSDCIKKSPKKARPYSNLGMIQASREQYDEAEANFKKAIQIMPNFIQAHHNLAALYEKRGETERAIEQYRKAIQVDPYFTRSSNSLGVLLLSQDKTPEAIKYFKKALQTDADYTAAHINLGLALAKQDKLSDAIKQYNKALQIDPKSSAAHFQLGSALVKLGKSEEGIRHIRKSLEIDPDNAEVHNNIGGYLLQRGKIDEAMGHFKAALKINPDIAEAHNNIGIILIHKGKVSEATFHFQEAVRINPEFELAQDNLRRALAIQQANLDAETARIQSELKTSPDDPVLNYVLGNLYLGKGNINGATGRYRQAIAVQPDFPQALNNLAMAYTFGGQYDQAQDVFQKLIDLYPDNSANYYNVAVLYALQDKKAEALEWLNKAVDKGYDNWELIKTDKDLESIRDTEGYRELIEGH